MGEAPNGASAQLAWMRGTEILGTPRCMFCGVGPTFFVSQLHTLAQEDALLINSGTGGGLSWW